MLDLRHRVLGAANGLAVRLRGEGGQGLVEYALILSLIALVCVGALTSTGTTVNHIFSQIASDI